MIQQIRRKFTPQEKVAILRQHLLEGKPVSDDCDSHDLKPNRFYRWRKEFFENKKKTWGALSGVWVQPDLRDRIVDFVRERAEQTELPASRLD